MCVYLANLNHNQDKNYAIITEELSCTNPL